MSSKSCPVHLSVLIPTVILATCPACTPARIVGLSEYDPNDFVSAGVKSTSAYSCPVVALSLYAVISCTVSLKANM